MSSQEDLIDLINRVDDLTSMVQTLTTRQMASVGIQCSAEIPHPDLVYLRDTNQYLCPCGKVYNKGKGVLLEVN